MPSFVQGSGVDAAAEFASFQSAQPLDSTSALATLTVIRNYGTANIPPNNHTVRTHGFHCLQAAGWAVFYVATGPQVGSAAVVVILVEDATTTAFQTLVAE